eukprot:CAMPEP_0179091870 /NCGR_PEP_ID=MMETSP0796-20121207/41989_1 /TAXON_ID=73915 /ORGANISM="Pyrodinium bahamense, Strain pbaha01" /LENGTH=335 /DNA_ID=CAMNT_0020789467 /DNA_START=41 /DNA_END=1049 /DNA_ORIENTATION=-
MAGGKQQMMPGDWTCPNCQDLVFARNNACRRCSTPKPGAACMGTPSVASQPFSGATHGAVASPGPAYGRPSFSDIRPGDWHCPACFDLQFARNSTCRRCGTAHPGSSGQSVPSQQAMTAATFYSPPSVPAPMAGGVRGQEMRPGDWICPHCSDHVFAKNDACRRCSTPRPVGGAPQAPSSTNGYSSKPLDWGASQAGFEAELDKQHAAPPDAMVEAEVRRFRVLVIGFARVAMIFSSPGMLRAGVVGTGTQTLGTPASKINWVECPTALLASDVKHPALVLLLLAWRCAPVIGSARDVMTMSLRRTVRVGDVAHQDRPPMAMGMGSSLSPAVRRA